MPATGSAPGPVAAMVVASLAAPADPELAALLGAPGVAAVQAALWDRARRWAHDVAPDRAYVATSLDAAAAALHDHAGPVLLAAPDVPALSARHAAAGIDDLAAGCLLSLARATDGRPFLIALPRMDDELLELTGALFERVIRVASAAGRDIGMISVERRLVTVADARAIVVDPLSPPELVALLRPGLGSLRTRARSDVDLGGTGLRSGNPSTGERGLEPR